MVDAGVDGPLGELPVLAAAFRAGQVSAGGGGGDPRCGRSVPPDPSETAHPVVDRPARLRPVEAHRADALGDLARPDSAAPTGPDSMVHVVVDYDALVRGHTVTDERCEIPGIGPVPVSVARRLSEDAILKVLVTKGVDVRAVAHAGYTYRGSPGAWQWIPPENRDEDLSALRGVSTSARRC